MKLGLIGHNIATSQAPDIHKRLGELFGVSVSYELFDLKSKKESYLSDFCLLYTSPSPRDRG